MKFLLWISVMSFGSPKIQTFDISRIRALYHSAPAVKRDALELNQLMVQVDSTAAPVLYCYKGASEMIQAKYTLNPLMKLEKFNKGKNLIEKAIGRDTLNIEMRFIRYSIQSNIPGFLNYSNSLNSDKQMLVNNVNNIQDPELKNMIFNYLNTKSPLNTEELKQIKN